MTSSPYNLTLAEIRKLTTQAVAAKSRAYCPYSNFRVGACFLIAESDTYNEPLRAPQPELFYSGANVEVASTPVGTCAERCALPYLVSNAPRKSDGSLPKIRALAVASDIHPPASPCGMCRQMIREFCGNDMKVYMVGRNQDRYTAETERAKAEGNILDPDMLDYKAMTEPVVMTVGELLPASFGPDDLGRR